MRREIPWKFIPLGVGIACGVDFLYLHTFSWLWPGYFTHAVRTGTQLGEPVTISFYLLLILYVISEEVIFRLLPISIALEESGADSAVWTTAVISSIIFGWAHGNIYHVLIQGVGGFISCWFFLYTGGWNRRYLKATTASVCLHLFFNLVCFLIIYF